MVASANRLGHDGVERHEHAHPENGHTEEVEIPQCDSGEGLGVEVSHHDGVHHTHGHHTHLHHNDRQAEPKQGSHVGGAREKAGGEGHGWSGDRTDAPGRIRTSDPQLRRLMLYPTELRAPAKAAKITRREW